MMMSLLTSLVRVMREAFFQILGEGEQDLYYYGEKETKRDRHGIIGAGARRSRHRTWKLGMNDKLSRLNGWRQIKQNLLCR